MGKTLLVKLTTGAVGLKLDGGSKVWQVERVRTATFAGGIPGASIGDRRAAAGGKYLPCRQGRQGENDGRKGSAGDHSWFFARERRTRPKKKVRRVGSPRGRLNRPRKPAFASSPSYAACGAALAQSVFCCVMWPHSARNRALEMDHMRTLKLLALAPFAFALACGGSEPAPATPSSADQVDSGAASAAPADTSATAPAPTDTAPAAAPPPAADTAPPRPRPPGGHLCFDRRGRGPPQEEGQEGQEEALGHVIR